MTQNINADNLIPRLQDEFGYPEDGAKMVAEKIVAATPLVQVAFLAWWQSGTMPGTLEIEGFTTERLMAEHGMKPIAAFLTLDWLAREPQAAKVSLARGHDSIRPSKG